jgi:hypothetical protein
MTGPPAAAYGHAVTRGDGRPIGRWLITERATYVGLCLAEITCELPAVPGSETGGCAAHTPGLEPIAGGLGWRRISSA